MRISAVITGATDGIGKEIARGLIRQGATVVIGARSAGKGEAARTELAKEPGGGNVEVLPLGCLQHEVGVRICCCRCQGASGVATAGQ